MVSWDFCLLFFHLVQLEMSVGRFSMLCEAPWSHYLASAGKPLWHRGVILFHEDIQNRFPGYPYSEKSIKNTCVTKMFKTNLMFLNSYKHNKTLLWKSITLEAVAMVLRLTKTVYQLLIHQWLATLQCIGKCWIFRSSIIFPRTQECIRHPRVVIPRIWLQKCTKMYKTKTKIHNNKHFFNTTKFL